MTEPNDLNISNDFNDDQDQLQLNSTSNAGALAPVLMTAAVFFALGLMVAYILFGGSEAQGNTPANADEDSISRQQTVVALSIDGTMGALLPTATPLQLDDPDALANAMNGTQIAQAVEGTFIALTPTATPFPTDVPTELTFLENNPSQGPVDAPIILVEFSDYLCPYCARFHAETLTPLLEHYGDNVRFIYREYPIIGGQASVDISTAAACANLQGKYWEFADLIWANRLSQDRPAIDGAMLANFGTTLELDMDSYNTCREDGTGLNLVIADFDDGRLYNVSATPGFFISGERFTYGAVPIEYFMDVIDAQLIKKGITPPVRSS